MSIPGGIDLGDSHPPRGGTPLLLLGAVVVIAGILAAAYGIGQAIGQAGAIEDDAVARGVVREGLGGSIPFETPERGLSVYLDFDGVSNNSEVYDRAAGDTSCEVTAQNGSVETISGARQGTSATIGDFVSVGSVNMPTSSGRIRCGYTRFQNAFSRPEEVPFLLTPHKTSEVAGAVLTIIGGVFVALLGGWAAVVGHLRRRKRARLEEL